MDNVFESIRKRKFNLKHVSTKEPKPFFEKGWKLRKFADRKPMLQQIRKGVSLKKVKTMDKTKPSFAKGEWKLRKHNRDALFADLNRGGFKLKHVQTRDSSLPPYERFGTVCEEICEHSWKLKRANTKDKSVPYMPKDFKLRKAVDRKPLLGEIKKFGSKNLNHVKTCEKNELHFDEGYKMRPNAHKDMLKAISRGNKLHHVKKLNDRSAPYIEHIDRVTLPESLLKDIDGKGPDAICSLHHVSTIDKARPRIEKGIKLRKLDRKPFLGEVKEGVDLKHVETCDKSRLNLPRNFHMTSTMTAK